MSSQKQLPDVIFIGPLKTATSYIYDYYLHHPNVTTSEPVKELYYYDDHYHKGEDWYINSFSPKPNHQVTIDIAPSYMVNDDAIERIRKDNPNAKFIMTLRDPMERFNSHVNHHIRHGQTYMGFDDLLVEHPRVVRGSDYKTYVNKWTTLLGENNIFILDYRELTQDPSAFMEKICGIIDVPFNADYDFKKEVNAAGSARSPLLMRTAHIVMRFFIRNGLARLIDFAKKTGAKNLIFKEGSKFKMPDKDIEKASEYFKDSTQWYNNRFAIDPEKI